MKRFWDKVNRTSDPSDCWEWNAYTSKKGYGHFRVGKDVMRSHRKAYELCFGSIPPNMVICHHCDNTKCCNPSHLFLGTQRDNMGDAKKKRRYAFGERSGKAKLSYSEVSQIKDLLKIGFTHRKIADVFGVHHATIGSISRGKHRIHG